MRKTLGTALLVAGAAIAAVGAVGLAAGLHITIPRALLTVVEYKAPFIIGAGLMLLGAGLRGRAQAAARRMEAAGDCSADALMPPPPSVPTEDRKAHLSDLVSRNRGWS